MTDIPYTEKYAMMALDELKEAGEIVDYIHMPKYSHWDSKGVDFFVDIDVEGKIKQFPLQVKPMERRKLQRHRQKYGRTILVVRVKGKRSALGNLRNIIKKWRNSVRVDYLTSD